MHLRNIFILFLLILMFLGCAVFRKNKAFEYEIPPGADKISTNFYADYAEISQFAYLEYLYYTNRVHGNPEFRDALPDTTIWKDFPCLVSYKEYFLRHPAYRDYPVVGISFEQTKKFSKWRSDRVLEFILIREKLIVFDPKPDSTNYFTIEKYFSGKYKDYKPIPELQYYPEYRLPTLEEWRKIKIYADSLNKKNIKYCKKKRCYEIFTRANSAELFKGNGPCKNDSLFREPLEQTSCWSCKRDMFAHLLGNVREMSNEKGIAFRYFKARHFSLSKTGCVYRFQKCVRMESVEEIKCRSLI